MSVHVICCGLTKREASRKVEQDCKEFQLTITNDSRNDDSDKGTEYTCTCDVKDCLYKRLYKFSDQRGELTMTDIGNHRHDSYGQAKIFEGYEFGGPWGVTVIMIWSHYILYYFWYCLEMNKGQIVIPTSFSSIVLHCSQFKDLFLRKAIPSPVTWAAYLSFFLAQIIFAAVLPGVTVYGLPTAPDGRRLPYHCNGYLSYYLSLCGLFLVHVLGVFPLTFLADHFGEVLTAAILIADITSVFWYLFGLVYADDNTGRTVITGNIPYDFFMGTILYPRIPLGDVDVKMISEVRWSWLTLLLITLSCAVKQYEETGGRISPNMIHMLLAHWLYSNATVKGEHCIPCTWDMFRENYGWMLNFWNIAGVPFLYCFQSTYIRQNQSMISATYPSFLVPLNMIILLTGYYIFDTANCQKASSKILTKRHLFPALPWAVLKEPIRTLDTPKGKLLVDGWYIYARKMQYSGDILMALSWGLACGFHSPLPYFYVLFFVAMIAHRQNRDEARCRKKYGKYWDLYVQEVPNVFVPSAKFFRMIFNSILSFTCISTPPRDAPNTNGKPTTVSIGDSSRRGGLAETKAEDTTKSSNTYSSPTGTVRRRKLNRKKSGNASSPELRPDGGDGGIFTSGGYGTGTGDFGQNGRVAVATTPRRSPRLST